MYACHSTPVAETLHTAWHDHPEGSAAAGAAAVELAQRLWSQSSVQRTRVRRHLERYHGAALNPIDWRATFTLQQDLPLVWNITRSFVGTVVATVGASESPKVQFVTSDADWQTRRKAQKLDQFVDALALQPCPPYSSVHELRVSCLRDACLFGRGAAQVVADVDTGRVISERILPWELLYDTRDARYNCPREICRAYPMSRHAVKAWFPERASDIDGAKEATSIDLELELGIAPMPVRVTHDQMQLYELWLMADSPDNPGRHMLVADGIDVPLLDEEYDLAYPPFAVIYWDHPIVGGFNHSLADEAAPIEDEINRTLLRLADSARRTSLSTMFYKEGSVDPDKLDETRDAVNVPFTGDTPPVFAQAQAINPSMVQWLELQKAVGNDLVGISEMAQTGNREPGMSSGAAVRAVSAQQSKRFAWLWKQVEAWQLQWARLAVHAVRTVADKDADFEVRWPGAGFLRSIKWRDVDLDDDQFVMQIHAVGGDKNTPADRLQRAEEAFAKGTISQASYDAIVSGTQDNQSEGRKQNVQRELISKYIDQWLDATEEQLTSGWVDEKSGLRLIPPPIKWLDLGDAVLQVALAYLDAQLAGAPDANQQCFLDWLEMADSMLQKEAERKQLLQAKMVQIRGAQPAPGAGMAPQPTPMPAQ